MSLSKFNPQWINQFLGFLGDFSEMIKSTKLLQPVVTFLNKNNSSQYQNSNYSFSNNKISGKRRKKTANITFKKLLWASLDSDRIDSCLCFIAW